MSKTKPQRATGEDVCLKCGKCCRRKAIWRPKNSARPQVVVLDIYCPAMEEETKLCRIYDWRHTNLAFVLRGGTGCLKAKQAIAQHELPTGCPYTPKGYQGLTFDSYAFAIYRQARFYEYCEVVTHTRKQRDAIDEVLTMRKEKDNGNTSKRQ